MMVLTKRSFIATLAALALSLGANAMSGKEQKACKGSGDQKTILDECDEEDQIGQIDQISSKLEQTDLSQSIACSSSQSQCGASVTQEQCTHQASIHDQFAQHVGPKQEVSSWWGHNQQAGGAHVYQNWSGSRWNQVRLDGKSVFYHIIAKGVILDNVWLEGKFTDVDFASATILNTTFSGKFRNTDFVGAKFENVVFQNAKFKSHHLHRSNFDGATFENVKFVKTDIEHMTFRGAMFKNVEFECAKIKDWNCFKHAKVWVGDRWVKLDSRTLSLMGAKMRDCRAAAIDLSVLLH